MGGSLFYLDDPEIGLRDDPPKVKCENPQNGLACVPPKNDPPFKISTRVRVLSLRKQNNGYPKETSNIVAKVSGTALLSISTLFLQIVQSNTPRNSFSITLNSNKQ